MADDYTQDKDFLAASPEDQHAYLMSVDPDYAKAGTADQQAYLQHVSGSRRDTTQETLGMVSPQAQKSQRQTPLPKALKQDHSNEIHEGEETTGAFRVPGGNVPLGEGISEASALANLAGFIPAMSSPMGMPEAAILPRSLRTKLAEKTVAPLVYEGAGEAGADVRAGINPERGLVKEGMVGSKAGLAGEGKALGGKIGTRVSQIKNAANSILDNHPSARNVTIDAEPFIDQAVNEAIRASEKTGQSTERLESVRNALKTKYGAINGSPRAMNDFASEIQNSANELGAFKNTQPAEASAATAMRNAARLIRGKVNDTVPGVGKLNQRMADLLDAGSGIRRNMLAERGQSVLGSFGKSPTTQILNRTIGSAPVRTGIARVLNAGNIEHVPAELPQAVPRNVAGYLPPAPQELGPIPAESYVRGVPATAARRNVAGYLPPAPKQLGPVPDESFVRGVNPATNVQRNPQTGQMRRVYEGVGERPGNAPVYQAPAPVAESPNPEAPRSAPGAKQAKISEAEVKERAEWEAAQHDRQIQRAKDILRNPKATDEEKLHARRVIESTREIQNNGKRGGGSKEQPNF